MERSSTAASTCTTDELWHGGHRTPSHQLAASPTSTSMMSTLTSPSPRVLPSLRSSESLRTSLGATACTTPATLAAMSGRLRNASHYDLADQPPAIWAGRSHRTVLAPAHR